MLSRSPSSQAHTPHKGNSTQLFAQTQPEYRHKAEPEHTALCCQTSEISIHLHKELTSADLLESPSANTWHFYKLSWYSQVLSFPPFLPDDSPRKSTMQWRMNDWLRDWQEEIFKYGATCVFGESIIYLCICISVNWSCRCQCRSRGLQEREALTVVLTNMGFRLLLVCPGKDE